MTCGAILRQGGVTLFCHQETSPHPGVMHHDREHGAWWGDDGPGPVRITGDAIEPWLPAPADTAG